MKIQHHRIDTNVVVGLLVREFCCSGTDVSAKVLAMYAGTRTPSMEPQWLAAGLSQCQICMCNLFFKDERCAKNGGGIARIICRADPCWIPVHKNTSLKFEKLRYYLYLELYHEIK